MGFLKSIALSSEQMDTEKYTHYLKVMAASPVGTTKRIAKILAGAADFATISETFMKQEYFWLASHIMPSTTLIDIGANIGDTAIYFAQFANIKKVVAYEPMPNLYVTAKRNIDMVPFKAKISLKNAAIGTTDVKRLPRDEGSHVSSYSGRKDSLNGRLVESRSLENEIRGLRNVAIKCDCEGSEYSIFTEKVNLANVYAVQMEYHSGAARLAKVFRKKGFSVTYKDTFRKGIGYLYAIRPSK